MTDKRFKLVFEDYDTFSICDNDYIQENKHYHTLKEIVDLLNELHEENQFLKRQVDEDGLIKLLNEVAGENLMLKGELTHYKLTLMSLEEEAKRLSQIR